MPFRSLLAATLASIALAACYHVPPTPHFDRELVRQYDSLDAVKAGLTQNGYAADYFRKKATLVDNGVFVAPEDPDTWNVPREERPELNNAYDMLAIALGPDQKRDTHPVAAANAQAHFDCWVEQSHRNFVPSAAEPSCRPAFYTALCRMYDGQCRSAETVPPVLKDRIYRIYFDTGRYNIDAADRAVIARAVAAYQKGSPEVVVAGHADRVGKADYNMRLSRARSDAVRDAMVSAGVPAARITDKYFGEKVPLVATPDNVASPGNRRVLIVVR